MSANFRGEIGGLKKKRGGHLRRKEKDLIPKATYEKREKKIEGSSTMPGGGGS